MGLPVGVGVRWRPGQQREAPLVASAHGGRTLLPGAQGDLAGSFVDWTAPSAHLRRARKLKVSPKRGCTCLWGRQAKVV